MKREVLLALLLCSTLIGTARAQGLVRSVRLDLPAQTALAPGAGTTLVMQASELVGVEEVQLFKLSLLFDPERVEVIEVRPGSGLGAWPADGFVVEFEDGFVRISGVAATPVALSAGEFLEVDLALDPDLYAGERPRLRVAGAQPAEPILFISDAENPGAPVKVTAPDAVFVVQGGLSCLPGDALADGEIDAGDAVAVLRIVTGLISSPDAVLRCGADADEDGAVRAGDATLILRRAVGLEDETPARFRAAPVVELVAGPQVTELRVRDAALVYAAQLRIFAEGRVHSIVSPSITFDARRLDGRHASWAAASASPLAGPDGTFMVGMESDGVVEVLDLVLFDAKGRAIFEQASVQAAPTPSRSGISLRSTPNPFNPATTFWMELPVAGRVRLELFDLRGRQLALLLDEVRPAGRSSWRFDASAVGSDLPSGVYFARLSLGRGSTVHRVTLLK